MKQKLLFCAFLLSFAAQAQQNLVPNPSFEDTINCPHDLDGVGSAAYWFSAKYSPDYFNFCANNETPYVGVPDNFCGYQMPLDGYAYAGLTTYIILPPPAVNYREILETPLSLPLTVGVKYYVSAYISSGENETTHCFSDNFGFRFTNIRHSAYVNIAPEAPIDNFSHIHSVNIIEDTANWVWVGGSFVADSAYQYLMLGNFYDDSHTDTIDCIDLPNYGKDAYYYIDKVSVSTDSTENRVPAGISSPNKTDEIYVFPNPTVNTLSIKNTQHYKSFTLFNAIGQKVKEDKLTDGVNTIDISAYERGIYFLLINNSATKILFIN